MNLGNNTRRTLLSRLWVSWIWLAALLILCTVLGVLQYQSIGALSVAEQQRLRGSLQASLNRLSQEFNNELIGAAAALLRAPLTAGNEPQYAAAFTQWRDSSRHSGLILRMAIAYPRGEDVTLRILSDEFHDSQWPAEWLPLKSQLTRRLSRDGWPGRAPGPPPVGPGLVFEVPRFARPDGPGPPRGPGREAHWLIFEVNLPYARDALLPELLRRHLGAAGSLDYQIEVVARGESPEPIYRSESTSNIAAKADASVGLFEIDFGRLMRDGGPGGRPPGRGVGYGGPPRPESGRWRMSVRHRSGSLEAVVASARRRSLAVTGGVLLLMLAAVAALISFTRRSQRLAELQMDFVAGVSHELRTPLTVIRTAAYNLRGKMARNPAQVERYGALIQKESERLTDLVEQVLHFASAKSGNVIRKREPVSVETVVDECLEASKSLLDGSRCVVEKEVAPGLPLILGDSLALQHAVQNLVGNAVKYGAEGGNWIGVFVRAENDGGKPVVEICIADRGPGIPAGEQRNIFDPFFRGKRAVQDQIHGTGLGLSLVQGIVEAHGGTIHVRSEPTKGTEFTIRIPTAPPQFQDEFTHSISRG